MRRTDVGRGGLYIGVRSGLEFPDPTVRSNVFNAVADRNLVR